jgi:hypothetical protein
VIHAPRQIGKTTAILSLAAQLTASEKYSAVVVSAEVGAPFSQDIGAAEAAILGAWRDTIAIRLPIELQPPPGQSSAPGQQIRSFLQAWAQVSSLPLVVFIDEIDSLQDVVLVSILRQLRDGYTNRPHAFPHSLGLIGLRDVRDYKIASGGSERLNTSSPFNIKIESLTLRNFNAEEVVDLCRQHTDDNGQVFDRRAAALALEERLQTQVVQTTQGRTVMVIRA